MKILLVVVFALTAVGAIGSDHPPNLQYMVKLEVSKAGQCSVCSGSFIDTNWILTAAHCVHGMDSVIAYVGPPFEGNCSIGHEIEKNSIVIHEFFGEVDHSVYHYDIALIKFTQKSSCGPIKPVQLLKEKPSTWFYRNESVAIVRFSSSCGQSPGALSVHPVTSDLRCRTELIWGIFQGPIMDRVWCVSTFDYGGSCVGDTSAHIIMTNTDGGLIGIMTNPRKTDCGGSEGMDSDIMFTDVYQFKSWIRKKVMTVNFSSERSMVKLYISKNGQRSLCSGSFVNPNWILTAAHCVHDANSVIVDVGRHFSGSCSGRYAINKSEIIVHPSFSIKYSIRFHYHDIALIKFTKENSCKRYWVVRLPSENVKRQSYYNSSLQFNRFLDGLNYNTSSSELCTHPSRVIGSDYCKRRSILLLGYLYVSVNVIETREPLEDDQLCVYTEVTNGPCFDDTSGHLFNGETAELVGIMSRQPDQQCLYVDEAIFTRVSYYVRWIKSHFTEI